MSKSDLVGKGAACLLRVKFQWKNWINILFTTMNFSNERFKNISVNVGAYHTNFCAHNGTGRTVQNFTVLKYLHLLVVDL
jgi:hypothetical protein